MSQLDIRHASVAGRPHRALVRMRIASSMSSRRTPPPRWPSSARLERGESVILLASVDGAPVGFCQMYLSFCSVIAAPIYVLL